MSPFSFLRAGKWVLVVVYFSEKVGFSFFLPLS